MKKFLVRFMASAIFFCIATPQLFAGIPIQEKASSIRQEQLPQVKKKEHKRISKFKQKMIQRSLKLDVDEGDHKTAAIVFAILIPFVGVAIYQDRIGRDFWITLLLTALLYIPGLIYALSIVLR